MNTLLTSVLPSVLTGAATWYFSRRKYKAEASSSELENVEKALAIYRSIISDLNGKIKELEIELEQLQKLVSEYKKQNNGQSIR